MSRGDGQLTGQTAASRLPSPSIPSSHETLSHPDVVLLAFFLLLCASLGRLLIRFTGRQMNRNAEEALARE